MGTETTYSVSVVNEGLEVLVPGERWAITDMETLNNLARQLTNYVHANACNEKHRTGTHGTYQCQQRIGHAGQHMQKVWNRERNKVEMVVYWDADDLIV